MAYSPNGKGMVLLRIFLEVVEVVTVMVKDKNCNIKDIQRQSKLGLRIT